MTVLDTLNFVAFNPLQNNNPIAVRRRKLIAKIDEQIQLAANKDYTPTQHKWVTDEHGNQRKVEVAKRVKRWWTASVDGKKMSNVQQADKVGLKVTVNNETKEYQFLNEDGAINETALIEYEIYLLSTTVSRKKKLAKTAIASAAKGIFP